MRRTFVLIAFVAMAGLSAATASAQVTPAAGFTPPDDTPKITTGVTLFSDFTYQSDPTTKDADGNVIHPATFNVSRTYINVNGQVSHIIAFRITPDIFTDASGNYAFRVKYAFAQINLDDWMTKGSWIRIGQQQTPWIDYAEGIYRYRFQGGTFVDREGYLSSSDKGVSFHYNLPSNFGDFHVGVFNGEGYGHTEALAPVNNEKSFQARFSLRPFATQAPAVRGLRLSVFYDADNYVQNAEKKRLIANATFEHKYANLGVDYLDANDQKTGTGTDVNGKGTSFWITPRYPLMQAGSSLEGLVRYDQLTPSEAASGVKKKRVIAGFAYWLPHTAGPVMAIMFDYDHTSWDNSPTTPTTNLVGVHMQVNF